MGFAGMSAVAKLLGKEASDDANKYLNEEGLATLISLLRQPSDGRTLYNYGNAYLSVGSDIVHVNAVLRFKWSYGTVGGLSFGGFERVPRTYVKEITENYIKIDEDGTGNVITINLTAKYNL